jgi:tetratricopeptide (TPR) repeat protein
MSHQPTGTEALVAAFSFNKNLHQAKLDWRFNEQFTDPRWATAYVGAELLAQQERAAKRYDQHATALRGSVENQTRQNAENARALQATIRESSEIVRREMTNVQETVKETTRAVNGLASQVSQLAWLQAEQNEILRDVLDTIREGRANECRQLVEQGERNFDAGFLAEAEDRFRLALQLDNTDYPTHQNLGLTLVRLGRMDEALDHFKKALAFPPKRQPNATGFFVAQAATHVARVLYATSDYAGAETYLQRALDADTTAAKNWYDLAVVRTYLGNADGALTALRRAIGGDVMLAGAALADEELASIRPAIEQLVLEQTKHAMQDAVAKPVDAFRVVSGRVTEIARAVGMQIPPIPDADAIVRLARERGTLPAIMEAAAAIEDERVEFLRRAIAALERAGTEWEETAKKRLAAQKRVRQDEENAALEIQFAAQEARARSSFLTRSARTADLERAQTEALRIRRDAMTEGQAMHLENATKANAIKEYLSELRALASQRRAPDVRSGRR